MARVLFVQDIWFEVIGTMSLSAVLKQHGHHCDVIISNNGRDVLNKIYREKWDFLAFSCVTGQHLYTLKMARFVKENYRDKILTIFGGPHATYFPEMITNPYVDIVCRGEGEYTLLELADTFDRNEDISGVLNLWVKDGHKIIKNPLRPLVGNLDDLPFPDREIYYKYGFLRNSPVKRFMAGRGCPFACSFCFSQNFNKLYGRSKFVRMRSVENVISEIKAVRERYPLKFIRFEDDTFIHNRDWFLSLMEVYEEEISIPFTCGIRANLVDEEIAVALKRARCAWVFFGLESGNERMRNSILEKGVKDKDIERSVEQLKKHKIGFSTTNMLGLPGETLKEAFETIEMNIRLKVTDAWFTILQPYHRTEIADYCIKNGYLENICVDEIGHLHGRSLLRQKDIKEVENLHKFANIIMYFPWCIPIVKKLIKLPPNRLFDLIHKIMYLPGYLRRNGGNISPFRLVVEAIKMRDFARD